MLTLFSGPFQPGLEDAFLDRLKNIKKEPFSEVLIVGPTARLVERLQVLVANNSRGFFNVSFTVLNALVRDILPADAIREKTLISDPAFFDALAKILIKKHRPFSDLEDQAVPQGFPPSIRGTLRDLQDAGVRPFDGAVVDAIKEAVVGKDADVGSILQVLALFDQYRRWLGEKKIDAFSDLAQEAADKILNGQIKPPQAEILFYGFSDMTGVQWELFEALAKKASVSFFVPFVRDLPAYDFVLPFWERLVGLSTDHITLPPPKMKGTFLRDEPRRYKAINASGLEDEAWAVANEITRLREEGIPFSEMAVVARRRERARARLPRALQVRSIPYRSSLGFPLSAFPKGGAFFSLLDWLEAPEALRTFSVLSDLPGLKKENLSDDELGSDALSWEDWAVRFKDFFEAVFDQTKKDEPLFQALTTALDDMGRHFGRLSKTVSRGEFIEALRDKLTQTTIPDPRSVPSGVSLLHAEGLRGLSFKVVILLGLDEKEFPLIRKEDPFLKDDARFALKSIGYRIQEKGQSLPEERFLFHLANMASTQDVLATFQRSDLEGKTVGASLFYRQWLQEAGGEDVVSEIFIPRAMGAKMDEANPETMGRLDLIRGFLRAGKIDDALSLAPAEERPLYENALRAQKAQEMFSEPGPYDGFVRFPGWNRVFFEGKGSASSMEKYGTCPFKFFAENVLRLKEKEEDIPGMTLDSKIRGGMIHGFLKEFVETQNAAGWAEAKNVFPEETFTRLFYKAFSKTAEELCLFPSMWEALKAKYQKSLRSFCEGLIDELATSGYRPVLLEKEMEAAFQDGPLSKVPWGGTVDRVDEAPDRVRIFDYKSGYIPTSPVKDTLQGVRWQSLLYPLLYRQTTGSQAPIDFGYQKVDEEGETRWLTQDEWKENEKGFMETAGTLLGLMEKGAFPIFPSDEGGALYCDYCDMASICGKSHGPRAFRAKQGLGAAFREVRAKKVQKPSKTKAKKK